MSLADQYALTRTDPTGLITAETIARVQKSLETRAITTQTGLQGYDLSVPAQVVVPQVTPVVNNTPRKQGPGVDVHHFKSITSLGWNSTGAAYPGATTEGATTNQLSRTVA